MDVFNRLYRIVRAQASADRESFNAEPFNQSGPTTAEGSRASDRSNSAPNGEARTTGVQQDPVLAAYFANLEIPYGSDVATVKKAWKKMMKKYHPDLHSSDPDKRNVANRLCAELTHAYQELTRLLSE